MSEEPEIVAVPEGSPVDVHPAQPSGTADEPMVSATTESVAGTVEPSNPVADAVYEYLQRRVGEGAPTIEEAFQKYRDRRQANADGLAAYLNGTGPFPLEGHRI